MKVLTCVCVFYVLIVNTFFIDAINYDDGSQSKEFLTLFMDFWPPKDFIEINK